MILLMDNVESVQLQHLLVKLPLLIQISLPGR